MNDLSAIDHWLLRDNEKNKTRIVWASSFVLWALLLCIPFVQIQAYAGDPEIEINYTTRDSIRPLTLGDTLSSTLWNLPLKMAEIGKEGSRTVSLKDYRGKLIILDFWATWCGPCVKMVPKADSLQKLFSEKLKFIPISKEPDSVLNVFSIRMRKTFGLNSMETYRAPQQLYSYFPHNTLPHYVWINQEGLVCAITDHLVVNKENIQLALQDKLQALTVKEDMVEIPYDWKQPLFFNQNAGNGKDILYHHVLSGFVEGVKPFSAINVDSNLAKVVGMNQTIASLYKWAFGAGRILFTRDNVILDVKEPSKLTSRAIGSEYLNYLRAGNGYCYEIIVPAKNRANVFKLMQRDLLEYFPYKAKVVRKKKDNYGLFAKKDMVNVEPSNNTAQISSDRLSVTAVNVPINRFLFEINNTFATVNPCRIVNRTGYTGNIDIELEADLRSITAINKGLAKYGLYLKKVKSPVYELVITDNPK